VQHVPAGRQRDGWGLRGITGAGGDAAAGVLREFFFPGGQALADQAAAFQPDADVVLLTELTEAFPQFR